MAADRASVLPEFEHPPVNETVLSLQFTPIPKFGIPHFGLYWATVRAEFPQFQVHPALPSVTEQLGEPLPRQARLGIQLVGEPDARCWFLDRSGNRLLQVQKDRFIHNWRQVSGDEEYPRYPSVRSTLETQWGRFCEFLRSEGLEAPHVNQCEVTYVNHIEYGKGWHGYGELSKVISGWSGATSGDFLPAPERANMEVHYRLPNDLGRLHVSMEPVFRGRDYKEVLQLTLTARGAPKSSALADILNWLDLGREWVVKGFTDLTTKSMHVIWGRKS